MKPTKYDLCKSLGKALVCRYGYGDTSCITNNLTSNFKQLPYRKKVKLVRYFRLHYNITYTKEWGWSN